MPYITLYTLHILQYILLNFHGSITFLIAKQQQNKFPVSCSTEYGYRSQLNLWLDPQLYCIKHFKF